MNATAQKQGANGLDSARPESPPHAEDLPSMAEPRPARKRRTMPPGPMAVRGVPGRLLARLWERAPWSSGAEVFVWPSPALLQSELGLSRTAYYRAAGILERAGWVTRAEKRVRGYTRDVRGWVLHDEPDPGPLFAKVVRPDDVAAAEVLLERYGEDGSGTPASRKAGLDRPEDRDSHPLRNGIDQNSSSAGAHARDPGEDDEDEDGYRDDRGNRLPAPFKPAAPATPRNPPPTDPPPAAAESVERDLWDTAEQERYARLGGWRPRHPTREQLTEARALIGRVRATEGVDEAHAVSQIDIVIRARVAYAADRRRKRDPRAEDYVAALTRDPFSPRAYDTVMAYESARGPKTDPVVAWRAREWTREPDAPPPPPDPTVAAMADAFLAGIRPPDAEAP